MGISIQRYRAHLAHYESIFTNYRRSWPWFLFRHEPIENAIKILKSGCLLSRFDAMRQNTIQNDVAPSGIIQHQDSAHQFARLYFRPRNPTQYHIEGIRKTEYYYQGKHAGFLVMLVFNAEQILTAERTKFSCGNMQSSFSNILDGDAEFDNLDFSGIYHDVANPTHEQVRQRCAEVLLQSPLLIDSVLVNIVVRTDADALTVRHFLDQEKLGRLIPLVKKSRGTGIFFNNHAALDFVDSAPGRINFRLRPHASRSDIETKITVLDPRDGEEIVLVSAALKGWKVYYVEHDKLDGRYLLKFELEDCLAHLSFVGLSQ